METFAYAIAAGFFIPFILVPVFLGFVRLTGLYTLVDEGHCKVYVLFGHVIGVLREPGLHILLFSLGPAALLVNWIGHCYTLDMRLDQEYLRSQAVNSEEGAPMGIGIWYEMFICDPPAYIFRNADPRGSLRSNVSNAAVRCLSNMKLAAMLENRHEMSRTVRAEVSEKSTEWGYNVGSVYIRKVHFRDEGMIHQIAAKVVNRLRQVTSSIVQDGANQVSVIASTAEREAAAAFAKAAAMRPQIVGHVLNEIAQDAEIEAAMFEILENQQMLDNDVRVIMVPEGGSLLADLLAGGGLQTPPAPAPGAPGAPGGKH